VRYGVPAKVEAAKYETVHLIDGTAREERLCDRREVTLKETMSAPDIVLYVNVSRQWLS